MTSSACHPHHSRSCHHLPRIHGWYLWNRHYYSQKDGERGILSWFLFYFWMGRLRQLDDPFRLQVVGMELTDNGLFQLDSLSIPWHSSLTCSRWVMERFVRTISYHIGQIYETGELDKTAIKTVPISRISTDSVVAMMMILHCFHLTLIQKNRGWVECLNDVIVVPSYLI